VLLIKIAAKMSSNKKKHTDETEQMQESDEEVSGDDETDEDEKILPGDEVNFTILSNFKKHFLNF
jgi:hypothetical protein